MIPIYCLTSDKCHAVIFVFTHTAMSRVILDHTTRSDKPENSIVDTKIANLLLFSPKYISIIYCWTDGHLGFFNHNAMAWIFFDKTTMSGMPENPIIYMKTFINLMFDLVHLECFTHTAMSKVFCGQITRSGISENPTVDSKIVNFLLFCQKLYQFNVWPYLF